ncbi:MAG: HalD/BesD family halogenase [bacterium]
MQADPPQFPDHLPLGYAAVEESVTYDPETHLQLEWPKRIWTLEEFGYGENDINSCASSVAVTSPFRMLSETGVKDLYAVAANLKPLRTSLPGARVPSHLAGGVYRSKFLKDLCACPTLLEHMSKISGAPLIPHTMPSQQVYINYAPDDVSKAIDSWHFDGIGFDYVLMVTDPKKNKGGKFEYFQGTKHEVASMFGLKEHEVRYGITDDLPVNQVIEVDFPAAGYAIFQQGNMVVHRATKLLEPADRITIVPGMVSGNVIPPDPTAKHDMPGYREPGIEAELARHSAWLASAKLNRFIQEASLTDEVENLESKLLDAVSDVTATLKYLKAGDKTAP